jgi:ribose/xylose/arabinose/galactoside ABC-type transport system permease subunit
MSSTRERFWDRICEHEHQFLLLFALDLTFLLASLAAAPFVSPGTVAGVLLQFNLVIFVALGAALAFVLYRCRQWGADPR